MSGRLAPPGPSFLPERDVRVGDRRLRVGIGHPTTLDDGWWLAILWLADDTGVATFRDLAPTAGPPPEPPLVHLGPALSGGLSGLILEEDGHLSIKLAQIVAPEEPARPWLSPVAIRVAIRWEPARAAIMSRAELAETMLAAFGRSLEGLSRP